MLGSGFWNQSLRVGNKAFNLIIILQLFNVASMMDLIIVTEEIKVVAVLTIVTLKKMLIK